MYNPIIMKQQVKSIIWGLAILALGVIFGGKALGLFNFDIFFKGWWTLFIIVPGVVGLITDKHKFGNLFTIAIGVILLLAMQGVFDWNVAWKVLIAAVLILAGLSLIFKSIFQRNLAEEIEKEVKKSRKGVKVDSLVAIFSGSDRVYNKEEFEGADITAVFGGAELDLSQAIFKKDTVIKAFCMFGGIDIIVPDDVRVKTKSGFIFGGTSDDRKVISDKTKCTIYVDAAGGFGGVTIKDSKN